MAAVVGDCGADQQGGRIAAKGDVLDAARAVAGDGAVADGQRAVALDAGLPRGVARERAVTDSRRNPVDVGNGDDASAVAADGAVAEVQTPDTRNGGAFTKE